ncbi:YdgA family protein [Deinococcus sp. KNUC1210]|uniref:YdgA family protein n=1 Tax=Deinococcus sp. KNUC1210 TaxID=2917691 RepID=UPI001EEFDA79|nr:YdgA family protein [Deinococcus sp. KNUC1210]ULH15631.1 YdgA family protein [Deinococcus sp. KNUC1210]
MTLPHDSQNGPTPPAPRRPVRPRWLIGGVTVVLLLGVAWAGSTMYAAGQAQNFSDDTAKTIDTALKANKLGSVEKHVYTRGLTESTDDLYIVLSDKLAPYHLHVRNHIKHGPLPGFQTVAQAVIDSEIIWDAKTQAAIDKALGGKKPVIHTVVGLGGTTDTTFMVPAGQYADSDVKGTWTALDAHFQTNNGGRGLSGSLVWPSGVIGPGNGDPSQGVLKISDVRYTVDQQPYLKSLSQGQSSFTIASIELPEKLGGMKSLNVTTRTGPQGANLESSTQASVAEIAYQDTKFSQLLLKLSARQLNSAALESLIAVFQQPDYQKMLQSGETVSDQTYRKLWTDAKPSLSKLLAGNPKLALDEISAQTPDGPLKLSLGAQIVDGQKIDLSSFDSSFDAGASDQATEKAMGLLQNLKLTADIEGKEQVIAGLLSSSGNDTAQGIAQSIDPLIEQGMITRSGDTLKTHLEFSKGAATINGKPFQ